MDDVTKDEANKDNGEYDVDEYPEFAAVAWRRVAEGAGSNSGPEGRAQALVILIGGMDARRRPVAPQ